MAIKRNIVSGITRSVARPITVQLGALLNYYRNVIGMNFTEDEVIREVAISMNYGGEEVLIEMND